MNKLLGQLMTMLMDPVEKSENGGGGPGKEADATENFYAPNKGVKIPTREEVEEDKKPATDEESEGKQEDFSGDEGGEEKEEDENDFSGKDEGQEGENEEGQEDKGEDEGEEKKENYLRIHPDDLKKVVQPQVGQQQEEKFTPEQLKAMFNPVEVTEELVAKMGHEDPKVRAAALQEFANATVKNAVSVARLLIQKETKRFEQAMGPVQGYLQEQQKQQAYQKFYGQHKDLAKFPQIVKLAANEVEATNADGTHKTENQIFKEVAVIARKQLQTLGVKINQPNANHGAGGSNVPKPNKFSSPGRSGGDQHSGKGKPNNADADIYAR